MRGSKHAAVISVVPAKQLPRRGANTRSALYTTLYICLCRPQGGLGYRRHIRPAATPEGWKVQTLLLRKLGRKMPPALSPRSMSGEPAPPTVGVSLGVATKLPLITPTSRLHSAGELLPPTRLSILRSFKRQAACQHSRTDGATIKYNRLRYENEFYVMRT